MNPKPIEEARSPLLAAALPALRRARRRAEEIARSTGTALVFVKDGRIIILRPSPSGSSNEQVAR